MSTACDALALLVSWALIDASERAVTASASLASVVVTVLRRICARAPDGSASLPLPAAISGCPVIVSAARNRMFCSFQPMVLKASVIDTAPWSLEVAVLVVASMVAVLAASTVIPPPVTVLSTISARAVPRMALVAMMPPSARLVGWLFVPSVRSVDGSAGVVGAGVLVPLVGL